MFLTYYFFQSSLFWPLKMMVVFYHESAHGIATWLTGGSVKELMMSPMQGGHVISSGGNRFITLTSGYLGSLIIGLFIFFVANHTKFDKWVMIGLGIWALMIGVFYHADTYTLLFSLSMALIMILGGYFLPQQVNDIALKVVGIVSMIYVPVDIWSDTINRSHLKSDAAMLADEIGGNTVVWGYLWLAISLAFIILSLIINYRSLKKSKEKQVLLDTTINESVNKTVIIRD